MKRKILILTASYGTGHITAAKSIYSEIKLKHSDWDVEVFDFLHLKGEPQQGKLTFFQKLYNFSMEKPVIFDTFFFCTNNNFCKNLLKTIIIANSYNSAKEYFNEFNPDIFVSTHPYWNFIVQKYKKEVRNVPYVCVITDSYMIHKSWIDKNVDFYCVIDEDTKHVLINSGINKIWVTGFPVNSKLFQQVDKHKILSELGLREGVLTILITIGLGALDKFLKIVDFLRKKKELFQLIIITGKYKELYDKLNMMEYIPRTKIIGWTDRMHDYLRVSDLVICKGGGAIVSESLSAGVPVLIPVFVPGQERGNVYVVKKYKLGFHYEDEETVFKLLDDIITAKIKLEIYKNNIKKYIQNNPAGKILKLVEDIVSGEI
ncbi:MAG: hypothetical protein NZ928_03170 [Endomicrobia bacterium]|nr:hypothetical protein [Endomicrobiia bacterium]MDW8055535.1 glycosyltransferase [Elusimicrobiota bacterium]